MGVWGTMISKWVSVLALALVVMVLVVLVVLVALVLALALVLVLVTICASWVCHLICDFLLVFDARSWYRSGYRCCSSRRLRPPLSR